MALPGIPNLPEGLEKDLDTKIFVAEKGGMEKIPEILEAINGERKSVLLVYDENTKRVAGDRVASILKGAGAAFEDLLLTWEGESYLSPDYKRVCFIRDTVKAKNAFPVAVGSGVINDLCKRAAEELDIPYMCVGTASSMDGYCSFGASLVKDGYKVTLGCRAPAAIIADPAVLKGAPYPMTASGYGDLYAKLTGGVDWRLADGLGIEKIAPLPWSLVQDELKTWVGSPDKLKNGDDGAFEGLFRGLTMAGIAMQIYHDSRPASGAEHLLSHVWEMEHVSDAGGVPVSHGFKVAVGTAAMSALMEKFYSLGPGDITVEKALAKRESLDARMAKVKAAFPDAAVREPIEKICAGKLLGEKELAARVEKIIGLLPALKAYAAERFGSSAKVTADLKYSGCPASPEDWGLPRKALADAALKAQMIRKRYTVLDAAYECGLLEDLAASL